MFLLAPANMAGIGRTYWNDGLVPTMTFVLMGVGLRSPAGHTPLTIPPTLKAMPGQLQHKHRTQEVTWTHTWKLYRSPTGHVHVLLSGLLV